MTKRRLRGVRIAKRIAPWWRKPFRGRTGISGLVRHSRRVFLEVVLRSPCYFVANSHSCCSPRCDCLAVFGQNPALLHGLRAKLVQSFQDKSADSLEISKILHIAGMNRVAIRSVLKDIALWQGNRGLHNVINGVSGANSEDMQLRRARGMVSDIR
jgi:hypothetical protein